METLRYVLLANGLLAIVSIAYYVLLRRETFFGANRLALWLGLTASLGLPLLELPDWRPQPVRAVMQRTAQVIVPRVLPNNSTLQPDLATIVPDKQTSTVSAQPPAFVWSWQAWLARIYVAVVALLLIRFGFQLISLRRLIRQSEHEPYNDFVVVKNPQVTSPFSFFNWVVLNADYHTSDELDHILRHERVHVRKRHSIDMLGAELLCILLWFNPAIYLFRYLLHQTLEFSADRAVLAEGVDAKTYQYNLLKVSLAGGRSTLTNHFSRSVLYQRVGTMNRTPSGPTSWGRYVLWLGLLGLMALACRHGNREDTRMLSRIQPRLAPTNATRVLANELEAHGMPWFRQAALLHDNQRQTQLADGRAVVVLSSFNYPKFLCLRNNRLALKNPDGESIKIVINGQESSEKQLATLTFDEVDELFVYQKWDELPTSATYPESYRLLISTTHKRPGASPIRTKWKQYLLVAAVSDYPGGHASTFSMNKLLEATFFNNKLAFVGRTKDEHLTLLDEYTKDIDLYINGVSATPADIANVHVREVDKLYANERPFEEWTDTLDRKSRFILYIQTTPKRAKRDSSYYVFSPFYTGDF